MNRKTAYQGFIKSFASVNLLLKKKSTANFASANAVSISIVLSESLYGIIGGRGEEMLY